MSVPVKLTDVVQAVKTQSDQSSCYLDRETGKIELVSDYDFEAAEKGETPVDSAGVPWPGAALARRILDDEGDSFVQLPTTRQISEYRIIKRFCGTVKDRWMADRLFAAINGQGAFRRFRAEIRRLGIDDDWQAYRRLSMRQVASEWCEDHGVEYLDE